MPFPLSWFRSRRAWLLLAFVLILGCACSPSGGDGDHASYREDVQDEPSPLGQNESKPNDHDDVEEIDTTDLDPTDSGDDTEIATPEEDDEPSLHIPTPEHVRGIYLTGWSAGTEKRVQAAIDYITTHGLNAIVIDIKDDDGRLSFDLPGTRASEIGANGKKVADIEALIRRLHEHNIYIIGRLVTFADPYASAQRTDWSIVQNGQLWKDYRNISWLSPWNAEAWDYNIEIGIAAAKLGFDEIQFDYVRLPESKLKGYNDAETAEDRVSRITRFLAQAREKIQTEAGVPVSADVFGIVTVTDGDGLVGQRYPDIARVVDVVSPMNYPSLYAKGELGIADPYVRPRDIVWLTVARAQQRTADLGNKVQRPWIQGYSYGAEGIEAQLRALAQADIRSFLVWNAHNVYLDDVNYKVIDETPILGPHPIWLDAMYSLVRADGKVRLPAYVPALEGAEHTSLRSQGQREGYAVELWSTTRPLSVNHDEAASGRLELVVSGAVSESQLVALPDVAQNVVAPENVDAPDHEAQSQMTGSHETVALDGGASARLEGSGEGIALVWPEDGWVYRIWAPTREQALAAANSMVSVRLLEGR